MGESKPAGTIPNTIPIPIITPLIKQKNPESKKIVKEDKQLKISTWNIKRGLLKRELEIKEFLKAEDLDILFLTETDTNIMSEADYKIKGYITIFHLRECNTEKVRIIALIKDMLQPHISIH